MPYSLGQGRKYSKLYVALLIYHSGVNSYHKVQAKKKINLAIPIAIDQSYGSVEGGQKAVAHLSLFNFHRVQPIAAQHCVFGSSEAKNLSQPNVKVTHCTFRHRYLSLLFINRIPSRGRRGYIPPHIKYSARVRGNTILGYWGKMPGQNVYQPAEFKPMVNWIYDVLLWLFSGTEMHGDGEGRWRC